MLIIREYYVQEYDEKERTLENEYKIEDKLFVYDGCHKIYLVEDENDIEEVKRDWGENEKFYDIKELPQIWNNSCPLKFIDNWKLTKRYVRQFYDAEFEFID